MTREHCLSPQVHEQRPPTRADDAKVTDDTAAPGLQFWQGVPGAVPSACRGHPGVRRGFAKQASGSLPITQMPDGPPCDCTRQQRKQANGVPQVPSTTKSQPASCTMSHLHENKIFVSQQRLESNHWFFTQKLSFVMSQLVAVVTETQN